MKPKPSSPKTSSAPKPATSAQTAPGGSLDPFVMKGELAERVLAYAAKSGKSADEIVNSALLKLLEKFESGADERAIPVEPAAPNRSRAEALVARALSTGVNSYNGIARQAGVAVSAPGLLERVQISEAQALNYLAVTLLNHSRHAMRMAFDAFPGSRREIADALLLAESAAIRAGVEFAVRTVKDAAELTEVQLFGLLCDSVDSWAEFEECLRVLDNREKVSHQRREQAEVDKRIDDARRALESALAARPGNPQVAA